MRKILTLKIVMLGFKELLSRPLKQKSQVLL
jgi:hypothetical protein